MKLSLCIALGAAAIASTNASSQQSGSSDCSFMCSDLYQPVCGSDGVTYSNECYLSIADCTDSSKEITQAHDGDCNTTASSSQPSSNDGSDASTCSDICPTIYNAVCGSDGVTYSNDCLLTFAQCKSGGAITQVSEGHCPGSSSSTVASEAGSGGLICSEVCIEILKPVCGSDGVTYPNSCFLGIASCKDPSITQASEEACVASEGNYGTNSSTDSSEETSVGNETSSPSCPDVCITLYSPVCGSDGITYSNSCKLTVASCNHPELHLTKVSDSACAAECKTAL